MASAKPMNVRTNANLPAVLIIRSSRSEPDGGRHDAPRDDDEATEPGGGAQSVHVGALVLPPDRAGQAPDDEQDANGSEHACDGQHGEQDHGERRLAGPEAEALAEEPQQVHEGQAQPNGETEGGSGLPSLQPAGGPDA